MNKIETTWFTMDRLIPPDGEEIIIITNDDQILFDKFDDMEWGRYNIKWWCINKFTKPR